MKDHIYNVIKSKGHANGTITRYEVISRAPQSVLVKGNVYDRRLFRNLGGAYNIYDTYREALAYADEILQHDAAKLRERAKAYTDRREENRNDFEMWRSKPGAEE